MSELRNANVKHCLDMLRDFHEVAVIDGDVELMEKKERANHALEQLSNMLIQDIMEARRGDTCSKDAQAC